MADINDVSTTIASALAEVGVSGQLDVQMEGSKAVTIVGEPGVEDVKVGWWLLLLSSELPLHHRRR